MSDNDFKLGQQHKLKDGEIILFDHYPLPPSVNQLYKHFTHPRTKRVVRVSTDDYKRYKKECKKWDERNEKLRLNANLYLRDEKAIKVKAYICLATEKIWRKDGGVKKLDVSNRGKALFDCLSETLDIDDRYFSKIELIKVEVDALAHQKCIIIFERTSIEKITDLRDRLQRL